MSCSVPSLERPVGDSRFDMDQCVSYATVDHVYINQYNVKRNLTYNGFQFTKTVVWLRTC